MMFTNMLGSDRDRLDGLDGNGDTPIAVAATSSGAMPGQLGSIDGNVDGAFFDWGAQQWNTEDCYGVALDYQKDTPMAFCFLPYPA